eukprot:9491800-Pyramimonas_sp.AAC.1
MASSGDGGPSGDRDRSRSPPRTPDQGSGSKECITNKVDSGASKDLRSLPIENPDHPAHVLADTVGTVMRACSDSEANMNQAWGR